MGWTPCSRRGTAGWRIVPEELDDGECDTHFSYVFEPENRMGIAAKLAQGILPEMHCWAVVRGEVPEVVDVTWGSQVEQARGLVGYEFHPGCKPDGQCLWVPHDGLVEAGAYYCADAAAMRIY